MKRITISLFNYLDCNENGKVSFKEMVNAIYPNLMKSRFHSEIINNWTKEYYTAKRNFLNRKKLVKKQTKYRLPEHGLKRLKAIFRMFDVERNGKSLNQFTIFFCVFAHCYQLR